MALSKQTQPRLDSDYWHKAEVDYVLEKDVVLDARDWLEIRETNVPVIMLARHLAKVGLLYLIDCTVSKRGGGGQPLPHPTLQYLSLYKVTGVRDLLRADITLPSVTKLELSNCSGVRLSDLTASRTFPGLRSLELGFMSGEELDGLPPTVRELKLSRCGRVEWGRWQSVGCHLEQLEVENSTLVLGDRGGHVTPWHSLQELTLWSTDVVTATGDMLYNTWCSVSGDFSRVREWLTDRCPQAKVTIDDKVLGPGVFERLSRFFSPPKLFSKKTQLEQQLLEPDMQQVYENACQKGTAKIFRGRVLLVGHTGAGKTSIKRRLLHQKFIKEHLSTIGIKTEGQTFIVDVSTAVDWKIETPSHKQNWTEEIVGQLLEGMKHDADQTSTAQSASESLFSPSQPEVEGASGVETQPQPSDVHEQSSASAPGSLSKPGSASTSSLVDKYRGEVVKATVKQRKNLAKLVKKLGKAVFTIWDFGGQEVYYTSHQTFLSRRAMYLLVMDITKSLDDTIEAHELHEMWKDTGKPVTARDFLDFWMKSVHTHLVLREAGEGQLLSPPVIIVCTKKDRLSKNKSERAKEIKDFISSVLDHLEGTPYRRHVHDIIAISNCTSGDPEVEKLRKVIVEVATQQPYWGEERPIRWMLLAHMLIEEADFQSKEPVMSLAEVTNMAEVAGVSEEEVPAFLKFHHNLGDLIYFEEAGMNDTVILSPQWLADMFSKVITHQAGGKDLTPEQRDMLKKGMLSREVAARLPDVTKPEILIRIMERFDMLIPCTVTRADKTFDIYLVPSLLQRATKVYNPDMPSIHFKCVPTTELDTKSATKGFLPAGLFHRHIAGCCRVKRWRHFKDMIFYDYMVFEADGFCFALHMNHNGITMSAFKFKSDRRNYYLALTELREEVQRILQEVLDQVFPNLSCVTYLQCRCFEELEGKSDTACASVPMATKEPAFVPVPNKPDFLHNDSCPHHRELMDLMDWGAWFGVDESALNTSHSAGPELHSELQPHMPILLSSLSHKVRNIMMTKEVLSFSEVKDIQTEPTIYAQNFKMYDLIFSKVQNECEARAVKEAICEGLCQSSQVCPFSEENQPATAEQQIELCRLRPYFIDIPRSDLSELLELLEQKKIIDKHMRQIIEGCQTTRKQVRELLDFISCTHQKAHEAFFTAIKHTIWGEHQFDRGTLETP